MRKKIIALTMAILVTIFSTGVIMAETQTETVTNQGYKIVCSLICDFSLFNNDKALALTNWDGRSGYSVMVMLFSRQNDTSVFKMMDSATSAQYTMVSGSKSGVYEFKSQHYVIKDSTSTRVNVCNITDW